jgi:hypothetical protein
MIFNLNIYDQNRNIKLDLINLKKETFSVNIFYNRLLKIFITNQNKSERVTRFIISFFLIPAPFVFDCNIFSISQFPAGVILLFNALSGMCVIYRFLVHTCKF